ncbi:MAG: hypothetical protein AB7J30_04830 [Hyphomicrobium sp.]|uniref:hypothetical protein n=1 Tax=Hyphomicrobium sp. TaxID=82 RepID=UPI003D12DBAA
MSMKLTNGAAIINEDRGDADLYFHLGLNAAGWWVLRETRGRKAGLFRTRRAAIKFACDESPGGNFTIIYEPDGLELTGITPRWAA